MLDTDRGEWKQFVQHRVSEILQPSEKHDWKHCRGRDNVADIGSCMIGASQSNSKRRMVAWSEIVVGRRKRITLN